MHASWIDLGVGAAGAIGSAFTIRHFKKLLATFFAGLHTRLEKFEQELRTDVADAKKHLEEAKQHLEETKNLISDLKNDLADVKAEFKVVVTDAKNQLAGMDRKVCSVCHRVVTKFETDAKGVICAGCKLLKGDK